MYEQQVRKISIDKLKECMNSDRQYVLADARDVSSYNEAHIPGAISLPADEVDRLAGNYAKDQIIVTYCGSYQCPASTMAAKALADRGFKKVYDYKGGIKEWMDQGNPVESNR